MILVISGKGQYNFYVTWLYITEFKKNWTKKWWSNQASGIHQFIKKNKNKKTPNLLEI